MLIRRQSYRWGSVSYECSRSWVTVAMWTSFFSCVSSIEQRCSWKSSVCLIVPMCPHNPEIWTKYSLLYATLYTVNLLKSTMECNTIFSWCTDISVTWCLSRGYDGGSRFLWNCRTCVWYYMVSHPQNAQVFGNTTEILKSWPHSA